MTRRLSVPQRYLLQYTAFLALLGLIAWLTRGQWTEFGNLRNVAVTTLLWLSVCFVASQLLAGLSMKLFTAAFDVHLGFKEWFGLVCIRSLGNYLPLSGGLTANAAYLKLRRDLSLTRFASLTAGNLVLTTLSAGCIGTAILLIRHPTVDSVHLPLLVFFAFVAIGSLVIILAPFPEIRSERRIVLFISNLHAGWRLIRSRPRLLASVFVLQTTILVLIALQYQVVFNDLDCDLDFASVMLLTVSTSTIRFASLLPANLGVRETIAGAMVRAFGYPFSAGLMAALVGRLVSMVWVFSLGAFFGALLIRSRPAPERTPAAAGK